MLALKNSAIENYKMSEEPNPALKEEIKCVIVGDGAVGNLLFTISIFYNIIKYHLMLDSDFIIH